MLKSNLFSNLQRSASRQFLGRGVACLFSSSSSRPPTAVVMLNMGGPETVPETGQFLNNLFSDSDIIDLGKFQMFGKYIAKRRTPKIEEQYKSIGGSPIRRWTAAQGEKMEKLLDEMSPETAPHKHYIAFRYAAPMTESALEQMKKDGVKRAVAFSQYPQWSCTTAGSSFNRLWQAEEELGLKGEFEWSVIDRWPTQPSFIQAHVAKIKEGLSKVPEEHKEKTVLCFSAHSLPIKTVAKGDQYPQEVGSTVQRVIEELRKQGIHNAYTLCWQSKVGPLPWLGPSTSDTIKGYAAQGHPSIMLIPIAFTTDHIETLFEIDIEYAEEAAEAGIKVFSRSPSLNDEPLLVQAQAEIVAEHIKSGQATYTPQFLVNCHGCVNPACRCISNPIKPFKNLRFQHGWEPPA